MPKNNQPQEFVAERTGDTDLKFNGIMLAEVHEDSLHNSDSKIARIYRTTGGNYIAQYIERNVLFDKNIQRAAKCVNSAEILGFYTTHPITEKKPTRRGQSPEPPARGHLLTIGKKVLEEAGRVDVALKDAHVEHID